MADELDANSLKQDNHFAPLGEALLAARNAKNLSVNDVSNSLRISVKQINAIEGNDFVSLPESAITRGFIRNYARLLGIDAEPLLASHRARMPDDTPASLNVKTTARHVMSRGHRQSWVKYILAFMCALVLASIWFFYGNYLQSTSKKVTDNSDGSSTMSVIPEVALPAAERQSIIDEHPLVVSSGVSGTMMAGVGQSPTQAVPDAAVASPIQQPLVANGVSADVSSTSAAAPISNYKVSMKFTEQTWVRAKNQSGKVIFEKTFAAGAVGGFDAEPPITMTIGNAHATQLQYLGQPVDIAAVTVGNVARVKLP